MSLWYCQKCKQTFGPTMICPSCHTAGSRVEFSPTTPSPMNSNPTPDLKVTRDNQQTAYPCTFPACGSPGEYCRPTCGSSAISAPAQPSGDGQRTPDRPTQGAYDFAVTEYWKAIKEAAALEAERDALRALLYETKVHHETGLGIVKCRERTLDEYAKEVADLRTQLQAATSRADALRRECDEAKKETEVMRREGLRQMAGWLDSAKTVVEFDRKITALTADLTAARDELAKWRDCADRTARALEVAFEHDLSVKAEYKLSGALDAYRALAAGQGEGAGM